MRLPNDIASVVRDYEQNGVVVLRRVLSDEQIAEIRSELNRYIAEDLPHKPADARTLESDGRTIRNLWRLQQHNAYFRQFAQQPELRQLVGPLVRGEPVLMGVETFNKPARVGSGVPYHQDNAYFCQTPPDVLTVWIAIDRVTPANGPVYYVLGSHRWGMLPTRQSRVRGNSIGLAEPPDVPKDEQLCATLEPGDMVIHHCQTIHHSEPNRTEHSRLGLLLVFRGAHTQTDPRLRSTYEEALATTPPA